MFIPGISKGKKARGRVGKRVPNRGWDETSERSRRGSVKVHRKREIQVHQEHPKKKRRPLSPVEKIRLKDNRVLTVLRVMEGKGKNSVRKSFEVGGVGPGLGRKPDGTYASRMKRK